MTAKRRIGKWMWVLSVVALILIIQVLFDPLSSVRNLSENVEARITIPRARAKWEAQNITHYSFEIVGFSQVCIPSARVEVRNGKVIQVNLKDVFGGNGEVSEIQLPPSKWANPSWPDVFFCDYADFTMPQIFDMLEQELRLVSEISFDANYGFVSKARFGIPGAQGLLSTRISDCCSNFHIENFQVLEE